MAWGDVAGPEVAEGEMAEGEVTGGEVTGCELAVEEETAGAAGCVTAAAPW